MTTATTTSTSTLTDRYVEATLRRLPARQRGDIERELRASIADAIDERLGSGADPAAAEVAVLTDLGDPARLAAGYADQPLHLIGPALFADYTRLLRALVATVAPVVTAAVAVGRAVDGDTATTVAVAAVTTAVTVTVHIAFWTTLVFAVIERTSHRGLARAVRSVAEKAGQWTPTARTSNAALTSSAPWTPAALPQPPSRRQRYAELISVTVAFVFITSFILLSPTLRIEEDAAGRSVPVLAPWLWDTGVVYVLLATTLGSVGFAYAKYYLRWNLALGVSGALVSLASPVLLIWLASADHVLNPAFADAAGWSPDATDWLNTGLIAVSVIAILQAIGEAVRQARRS